MVKVKEISTEKIEDIIFSLWEPLTDNEKKIISENITVEEYNKNDYIYKELEIPESIKWLITGKVNTPVRDIQLQSIFCRRRLSHVGNCI